MNLEMIHHPFRHVAVGLGVGLIVGLGGLACSSAQHLGVARSDESSSSTNSADATVEDGGETEKGGSEADDSSTDEPEWVNASYLVCSWEELLPEDSLEFGCGLRQADGQAVSLAADTSVSWIITGAGDQPVAGISFTPKDTQQLNFATVAPAKVVADLAFTMTLKAGGFSAEYRYEPRLPGLEEGGVLSACLKAGTAAASCFAEAGIDLSTQAPPSPVARVTSVALSGSTWTTAGHLVETGSGLTQLDVVPMLGIDRIVIRFSGPTSISAGCLTVTGVNVASYAVTSMSYDQALGAATFTLATPILDDKIRLVLDATKVSGLDGEWTNPTAYDATLSSAYPSGDSLVGGDFNFRFDVLRGDTAHSPVDNNGFLSALDLLLINNAISSAVYMRRLDIDSNGVLDANDAQFVLGRINDQQSKTLPSGEPG